MPVKGGEKVRRNMTKVVGNIRGRITKAAVTKAVSYGAGASKEIAPIEFGNLINSQFIRVEKTEYGWRGVTGYTVNYALPLESPKSGGRLDGWKPRPPEDKLGNGFNPIATQGFLRLGFEGKESAPAIRKIIIEGQRIR